MGEVDERTTQAVALLAVEAAVAIERADFLARLSDLAETDELTGLPNRRFVGPTIRRAVGYATRTSPSLCGDHRPRPLQAVQRSPRAPGGRPAPQVRGRGLGAALRKTDTLSRYGGGSSPSCSPAASRGSQVVLERLRGLTPEGQTCSVGLAEWSAGESDADLVARADAALYDGEAGRARRAHRLRVAPLSRIRIVLVPWAWRRPCTSSIRASWWRHGGPDERPTRRSEPDRSRWSMRA